MNFSRVSIRRLRPYYRLRAPSTAALLDHISPLRRSRRRRLFISYYIDDDQRQILIPPCGHVLSRVPANV